MEILAMATISVTARDKAGHTNTANVPYTITEEPPPNGPYLPYTATSFFKSDTTGAPIDEARTASFHNWWKTFVDPDGMRQADYPFPTIKGVEGSKWGTVYAEGNTADPVWKLTGTVPAKAQILATAGFHAPEWLGSMLTGTSDSPFCVMDRGSGFTMFGGQGAVAGPHLIHVTSAGVTYHTSNGLDYRNPRSNDTRNFTSRGRISDSMVIRKDVADWALAHNTDLGYVLHCFLSETRTTDGFCHPMVGPESGKNGWGAEGERLIIRPSIDLTTRGLTPLGLVIARTLQRHGLYLGDNAGTESCLKAEQESAGRKVWGGALHQNELRGITWDDFAVVQRGWQ